jgi:tetratricopeptide (TPR) repeat protein
MYFTIRQHAGAGLVAAGIVAAALAQGLFEPTAYAGASIVIWAAVIAGLVGRALPAAPVGRAAAVAGICLALTAVLATASVWWASDQGRAFEEAVRVSFYLSLFTLAVCTASDGGRAQWVSGLTIGLAAVSLLGLFSYLQPGILESGDQGGGVPNAAGRLSYPIGYWNGFGGLLAVAVTLLAYAGARAPSRSMRSVAVALLPVTLLSVWLTDSRGSMIAVVIGVVVLVGTSPDRRRQLLVLVLGALGAALLIVAAEHLSDLRSGVNDAARRADGDRMSALALLVASMTGAGAWVLAGRRPRLRVPRPVRVGLVVLVGLAVCAGVVAADPPKRFSEFKAQPKISQPGAAPTGPGFSSDGRWQYWSEALDAFDSAPLAGLGAGGYEAWWAQHTPLALFIRNAHSLPLQQAADLGSSGIALFLGFVVAAGVAVRRRLAAGRGGDAGVLTAVLIAAGFCAAIDWTWEIPVVFGPAVICAGLLTASAPSRPLARNAYWLGAGTLAAAWLAMVAGGLVVLTEIELRQSRDAADAGRVQEGINRANDAHTVQPWSAEPYTQLALLEEQGGNLDQAVAELKQAEQRDSEDWRLGAIEVRLQVKRGHRGEARAAFIRTHNLSPRYYPYFRGSVLGEG